MRSDNFGTLESLSEGENMNANYGVISNNRGSLSHNFGVIESNYGIAAL